MPIPNPGFAARETLAVELEDAGWPSVAEDVRDGVSCETILHRLRDIGEGDSEAAEIVAAHEEGP